MSGNSFPPAGQFILDLLHGGRTSVPPAGEKEWEEFSRLAGMHRLGPLMHDRLSRGPSGNAVPPAVKDRLGAARRNNAVRNLAVLRQLATVSRVLDAAGIPSLALKGAFLAFFAYPEPGLRPMRDLDLLLRPEDAVEAFELLKGRGFRPSFDGAPEAYFADRIHLPPLRGPDGVVVELHHRLTPPDMAGRGLEEGLWQRSVRRGVGGVPVAFPCVEDMLLHVCIHASLDHRLDLGPLALTDIAFLVRAEEVDWRDFLARVQGGRWRRYVLPPLYLAWRHVGAEIPPSAMAALGGGEDHGEWLEAAEHLLFSDPGDHRVLDYGVQEILYAGRWPERLSGVFRAVFPPRSVIARHFPVGAGSPLAYAYYPRRWCRLLAEKLPALLRARSGRAEPLRQLALRRSAFGKWLDAE